MNPPPTRLLAAGALALLASLPADAGAQPQRPWDAEAEGAASLLTGNTNQRSLFTRLAIARRDSLLEWKSDLSFGYADAAQDSVPRQVTKRTWLGNTALDYRPYARFTPFVFLNYESAWEKRIQDRVGFGVGGKVTFRRTEATTADFSLAMLGERTRPNRQATDPDVTSFARWSSRARVRHRFDERLDARHETFYRPRVGAVDSFTLTSTTALGFKVRESTALTVSYLANYDSEAIARGARSNDDGQFLFGVKTTF